MERTAKVSFDFIEFNPNQKGLFGDNVIAEMTEHNPPFVTPDIPIADLTTANDLLKLKTQQALSGDKVKIQERDAAEVAWDTKFRKEAEYVQRIAAGNKLTIAQSGYHSTQTEVHPQQVPAQAVADAWANKGRGSGIHAEMNPLADCRGFVFMLSKQAVSSFTVIKGNGIKVQDASLITEIKLTTKRKLEFDDVNSGETYFISACGFNAAGVGEWANSIEVIAP